jgi:hypothetical protein
MIEWELSHESRVRRPAFSLFVFANHKRRERDQNPVDHESDQDKAEKCFQHNRPTSRLKFKTHSAVYPRSLSMRIRRFCLKLAVCARDLDVVYSHGPPPGAIHSSRGDHLSFAFADPELADHDL